MNSRHLKADYVLAWPSAEIAVMGSKGAAEVLYRKEAMKSDDPAAFMAQKEKEYEDRFSNPFRAAERGYVDDIIDPAETRSKLIKVLDNMSDKRDSIPVKKHGNIPL